MNLAERTERFFEGDIWQHDLTKVPKLKALWIGALRVLHHAYRSYYRNHASLRAAGLTLLTLMALVPTLALMSALAKGFGFQDKLWDWIRIQVQDIPQIKDVVTQVLTFVDHTNFQTLGFVGLAILVYSVVMLLTHVEEAFNSIWHVESGRSWLRRFSDYTGIVLLVPLLVVASTSLSAFQSIESIWKDPPVWAAWVYGVGIGFVPFVLIWVAFTLLYKIMPNFRTRWVPCVIGGVVAGSLFIFVQWIYITFQVGVSRANAIYGAFAAIPLFLVYMHLSFQVLLLGAEISFGLQNVNAFRSARRLAIMTYAVKRKIGLAIVEGVCSCFAEGKCLWRPERLAVGADIPIEWVSRTVDDLVMDGILIKTEGGEKAGYVPARPPEQIRVADVLRALRGDPGEGPEQEVLSEPLRRGLEEADRAQESALEDVHFGCQVGAA